MATHAHYMSELNNIFQYKWIIYDSINAIYFMGLEYKIKSDYKMKQNICILYTGTPIIKDTRSCIIKPDENNDTTLNITITKPQFSNSIEMIKYNITAIKATADVNCTVANNIRVIHPEYIINKRMTNDDMIHFCSNIIIEMNKKYIKLKNQLAFLEIEDNIKKSMYTINFLNSKLSKFNQIFISDHIEKDENPDEPQAKRKKHY